MDVCTTEQLCSLLAQTEREYSTERMAEVLAKLLEALAGQSPQIYEKFREIQDLLRRAAAVFTKNEQIVMAQFPAPHIKQCAGTDAQALKRAGETLLRACEEGFLSEERYGVMAWELAEEKTSWKAD